MKRFILKYWWIPLTVIAVFALSIIMGFLSLFAPSSDDFGRKHSIPDGLEYTIPFDEYSNPSVVIDSLDADTYLQIWNGSQGGIYKYDFYYGALPAGEISLRCYEATKDIRLSAKTAWGDRIYESSKVAVDSTSSFSKLIDKQGLLSMKEIGEITMLQGLKFGTKMQRLVRKPN